MQSSQKTHWAYSYSSRNPQGATTLKTLSENKKRKCRLTNLSEVSRSGTEAGKQRPNLRHHSTVCLVLDNTAIPITLITYTYMSTHCHSVSE